MSQESRQRAVIALAVMIHEWWSDDQGRSAGCRRSAGSVWRRYGG
jgi:hypothetical protein